MSLNDAQDHIDDAISTLGDADACLDGLPSLLALTMLDVIRETSRVLREASDCAEWRAALDAEHEERKA